MASVVTTLLEEYERSKPYADERTKNWLLVNQTPVYVWYLTAAYLLFLYIGPKLMRGKEPFQLKWFMVIYNLSLVALSIYMFLEIILSTWDANYDYQCAAYNAKTKQDPRELRVAHVLWWYFFSKAIELMDTVLMVLRKKNNQITFLHVFHHATMLNIWWWVLMFIPSGQSYFGACFNSLVHVVMYSYYGLSVFPSLRKKMWWKHYITRFQLIQFIITLTHTVHGFYKGCDFPPWGQYLLIGYMIFMLILFSNFYIQAYIVKSRRSGKASSKNGVVSKSSPTANGSIQNGHVTNGHISDKKSD